MINWNQIEREEQALEKDYADGLISLKEMQSQINELHRDARGYAEQEAREAYESSLDANGYW